MRAQKITLAAVALAAGLTLTACQGNEDSAASTNDSGSSSSAAEKSGGSGASDENATPAGDDTAADPAPGSGDGQVSTGSCKTADLEFRSSHGMGEGDLLVSLRNTGGDTCSLKGFPGVDLKVDSGPGGLSAERSNLAAPAVAVNPGEETRFTLHYPRNDTGGSGLDITRIVVTPPGETHSKTLPVSINLPASDSPGATVKVDPVGTGKQ